MNDAEKIKYLKDRGLNHGDCVYFTVENQSLYFGPNRGTLNLNSHNSPFIEVEHEKKPMTVTINEGYDAYIGTIEKYE